jgi:hypothetical protein
MGRRLCLQDESRCDALANGAEAQTALQALGCVSRFGVDVDELIAHRHRIEYGLTDSGGSQPATLKRGTRAHGFDLQDTGPPHLKALLGHPLQYIDRRHSMPAPLQQVGGARLAAHEPVGFGGARCQFCALAPRQSIVGIFFLQPFQARDIACAELAASNLPKGIVVECGKRCKIVFELRRRLRPIERARCTHSRRQLVGSTKIDGSCIDPQLQHIEAA